MKVTILGAGAWGTALARMLASRKIAVTLWNHFPEVLDAIRETGQNERYLPGIELPRELLLRANVAEAMDGADVVVVASVSKAFRETTRALGEFRGILVSVTKGIEYETGLTMSGILAENAPSAAIVALSGPSFALEVARGVPTAIVAAGKDKAAVRAVQSLFHNEAFRVYTSSDILGVELGGALKNVIAISAGVCDGLGFGDNSKAALVTRAISEMRRLGTLCGARTETFSGLSGIGDLMVTCFSRLSRNRGFGERLGKGEKLQAILDSMVAVAEGFPTARSAYELARKHKVITPIIDEVYAMLYQQKDIGRAVRDLMARESKAED